MQPLLTPETLWNYWEGHRRLTLRTLEAFPEVEMHGHPVPNMRSFVELMTEIINVEESTLRGLQTGVWKREPVYKSFDSKADLKEAFVKVRAQTQRVFVELGMEKLRAVETDAWGMTSSNLERLFYLIDNEIHHRAQAYVFLRLLGLEPPPFYVR